MITIRVYGEAGCMPYRTIALTAWQAQLPEAIPPHVRSNITEGDGGCWLWTRSKSPDGYGWASLKNKTYQAHRLVYRLVIGEPPEGTVLDHLCRVRHCVNPAHLECVSPIENLLRSPITQAGMTVCAKGHELSWIRRQRRCLTCLAEYNESVRVKKMEYAREWRARRKAA